MRVNRSQIRRAIKYARQFADHPQWERRRIALCFLAGFIDHDNPRLAAQLRRQARALSQAYFAGLLRIVRDRQRAA